MPMLISKFDAHVNETDISIGKNPKDRLKIAIYGLNAEIGSVVAAVKKRILAEDIVNLQDGQNDEIAEELGDVIWYCFSLSNAENVSKPINIFNHDIANLKRELEGSNERAERIRQILDPAKCEEFLTAAVDFPLRSKVMVFEDYQKIAFLERISN